MDDLLAGDLFIERPVRGKDGTEIAAVDAFEGEGIAPGLHAPTVRDVQLCLGLDKGGLISSCKAFLFIAHQEHPCSRGNTILYGILPCQKNDYAALSSMADVYVPDIDGLRASGV